VRLFGGVTQDWIRIDFLATTACCEKVGTGFSAQQASSQETVGLASLTLTPNHRVLTPLGVFTEAEKLIQPDGSVELVLRNGAVVRGQATRISYSANTAALYEEASQVVAAAHGALAMQSQVEKGRRMAA
jgi:hypothetical protein